MNIIDRLIADNEDYKERFRKNKLFKIKLESNLQKDKFLDYFQIWSNEFQKMVLARVVFSEQREFTKLAWEHLIDEFGHNIEFSENRKKDVEAYDPIFEAVGSVYS